MAAHADTGEPVAVPVLRLRARWRTEQLSGLHGDVLDVGAGTGSSLGYLPADARVVCLEPRARPVRALERRAADRPGTRVLRCAAERIDLDDASIDAAVCCSVLCSVSDQDGVLREIHRVLRPGGRLIFLEHVTAPRGSWTRRMQRLVAPCSRLLDAGCDPARDTGAALDRSPLTVVELEQAGGRGPFGITIPHLMGVAARDA